MITESITIQGLYVVSLALTRFGLWIASGGPLSTDSSGDVWLTVFAVVALIISVVLLFWVFARHRQSEHHLNLQITELVITSEKLQERIEQLTATNEKQRQEIAKLYGTQVEDLEDITNPENTTEVNPSVQSSSN